MGFSAFAVSVKDPEVVGAVGDDCMYGDIDQYLGTLEFCGWGWGMGCCSVS